MDHKNLQFYNFSMFMVNSRAIMVLYLQSQLDGEVKYIIDTLSNHKNNICTCLAQQPCLNYYNGYVYAYELIINICCHTLAPLVFMITENRIYERKIQCLARGGPDISYQWSV